MMSRNVSVPVNRRRPKPKKRLTDFVSQQMVQEVTRVHRQPPTTGTPVGTLLRFLFRSYHRHYHHPRAMISSLNSYSHAPILGSSNPTRDTS